jgi:nucleoside-diphosphate-sugar epimerase
VYPIGKQTERATFQPLKEADAYPAEPQDAYGWEKLYGERMLRYYAIRYGFQKRIARFHNIYGEGGTYKGGREKAPAAFCRKVAEAALTGKDVVEVWGDGEQTRSFLHITDALRGIASLMESLYDEPANIGSTEEVTINQLARTVMEIANVNLRIEHVPGAIGVNFRNSDNTLAKQVLGFQPILSLSNGLRHTYHWVYQQVKRDLAKETPNEA